MYGIGRFNDVWKKAVYQRFFAEQPDIGQTKALMLTCFKSIIERVHGGESDLSLTESASDGEPASFLMQIPERLGTWLSMDISKDHVIWVTDDVGWDDLAIYGIDKIRRTGWTREIPAFDASSETADEVETVAEHSLKTAILAAALTDGDLAEAFEMGLCHDMAESIVGDLTPQQAPCREAKHRLEAEAFETLISGIENRTAQKLKTRFMDYLENRTYTAHVVHIADKLDMALQAVMYERCFHRNLQEFLDSAQKETEENRERILVSPQLCR